MQVKVIKKGETSVGQKSETKVNAGKIERKSERRVEQKIMNWISDLREKKNIEFARTQLMLSTLR